MNSNELLDALKKHSDVPSDYALAKRVLKVDVTAIRDMRERGLSEERALQIATLLGIDPSEVLPSIRAERADDPDVKKIWEKIAKTMRSAASGVLIVLGLGVTAPEPLQAAQLSPGYTLCEVRRLRRLRAALCAILAIFGLGAGPVYASDWTKADTAWQAGYIVLHVIDWGQTRNIAKKPDAYDERNLFLGGDPSIRRVDTYFAVTALVHTAIGYALPPDWRRGWQMVTIGFQAGVVGYNYSIGLKMDF